jgi:hypothetical protein
MTCREGPAGSEAGVTWSARRTLDLFRVVCPKCCTGARSMCKNLYSIKNAGAAERPTASWITSLGPGDEAAVPRRPAMSIQEWVSGRADQSCACG